MVLQIHSSRATGWQQQAMSGQEDVPWPPKSLQQQSLFSLCLSRNWRKASNRGCWRDAKQQMWVWLHFLGNIKLPCTIELQKTAGLRQCTAPSTFWNPYTTSKWNQVKRIKHACPETLWDVHRRTSCQVWDCLRMGARRWLCLLWLHITSNPISET